MRKEETQIVCTEITCDICLSKQDPRNPNIFWANQITHCTWKVPPDGKNHGVFSGDLCCVCRVAISNAIDHVLAARKIVLKN